jgi:stage II sporulation protein D
VGLLPVFEVSDGQRRLRVTGADLRQAWSENGVLSPRFQVSAGPAGWKIAGQGHGHGVGLCQWGARGQGAAGKDFRAILAHYYPGSELASLGY